MIDDLWYKIEKVYKEVPVITRNRLKLVFLIYRHYVLGHDWQQTYQELLDNFQLNLSEKTISDYETLFENISQYEQDIQSELAKGWSFERLNNLDKGILILGCYEIKELKTDKKIVINEYLRIIKVFDTDNNFSYINSVLDKI